MAEDIRTMAPQSGVKEFEKQYEKPYCVVLDSEYCSMGRMIGMRACEKAGYAYYDAVILLDLVKEEGVTIEEIEAFENKLRRADITKEEIIADPEYQRITAAFEKAIDIALSKGPCLIHDRTASEAIRARGYSVLSVLTYATDPDAKIVRAKLSPLYRDLEDRSLLLEKIQEETNIRINYHKAHSDTVWGDKSTYDVCLNSETLGRDFSAAVLASFLL